MLTCSSDIVSKGSKRYSILSYTVNKSTSSVTCFLMSFLYPKKKLLQKPKIWKNWAISTAQFTFGTPSVGSRLSAPAGHLPHQGVLFWGTEGLLAARAFWFPPPLTQDWGVVVIRGHLAAGRLVGVAGGTALAQGEGLLCLQQVGAPDYRQKYGWNGQRQTEGETGHQKHVSASRVYVCNSLWCFSSQKVVHHIRISLQQTHQNLILQIRGHLKIMILLKSLTILFS